MHFIRTYLCLCLLLVGAGPSAWAQSVHRLEVKSEVDLPGDLKVAKTFTKEKARTEELRRLRDELHASGYLSASIDSTSLKNGTLTAFLHVGEHFEWASLKPGNIDEEVLSSIGYRERLYYGRTLNPAQFSQLFKRILAYYENHGYPFAAVRLDSSRFDGPKLYGTLHVDRHNLTTIDSLIIKGDARVAPVYLYNYLSIKPGGLYDESKIRRIEARVREIPFLTEIKPTEVSFTPGKARIFLYLSDKKASQFNGILGVQPDNVTGKVTITGDAKLKLKNALGRGELIDLNWRKLRSLTQDLNVHLNYPFLFDTPIGTDLQLQLYKRDTTFLEVNRSLGLQYLLNGGDYIQATVSRKTSDLISINSIINSSSLPPFADVAVTSYGLGVQRQRLDYRLNPRKGYRFLIEGSVGSKAISKNDSLEELNPSIYDDVVLRSTQYTLKGDADYFLPLSKRSTLRLGGKGGYLLNDNMFRNEMYRIGGIRTLRGFDEESIIASAFAVGTLEYRFLLEQNSHLYAFFDGAWYERRETEDFFHDTPIGFGAGISFETKAGIFSLNYALGQQFDNPIQFRAAKVHFGFSNYF